MDKRVFNSVWFTTWNIVQYFLEYFQMCLSNYIKQVLINGYYLTELTYTFFFKSSLKYIDVSGKITTFFIENWFFSHIIYSNHSFPFLTHPSPICFSSRSTPPMFPLQERIGLKEMTTKTTKQDTVRTGKSPHIKARPGNAVRVKSPQSEQKSQRHSFFHC